jgi:hypothetical protein
MLKRKADTLSQSQFVSESKKSKHNEGSAPSKTTTLYDSDSDSSDESGGGAKLDEPGFKINEEYAKRFEHNKKRAELHRRQSITTVFEYFNTNVFSSGRQIPKGIKTRQRPVWRQIRRGFRVF